MKNIRRLAALTSTPLLVVAALVSTTAVATAASPSTAAGVARGTVSVPNEDVAVAVLRDVAQQEQHVGGAHKMLTSLKQATGSEWKHSPSSVWVSPIVGDQITLSLFNDSACFTEQRGARPTVRPGDCAATPASPRTKTPLRDSAQWMNETLSQNWQPEDFRARSLAYTASELAPRYVHVTGVIDADGDGYDDDARVAFRTAGRVACAELPLHAGGRGRVVFTGCRNLPPRSLARVKAAAHASHVYAARQYADLLNAWVSDETRVSGKPLRAYSDAAVARVIHRFGFDDTVSGWSRVSPSVIEVRVKPGACRFTLTFPTAPTKAPAKATTVVTCRS